MIATPDVAARLGLEKLWVKDESSRLELPAFKILGASWAVYQAARQELLERTGVPLGEWHSLDALAAAFAPLRPLTLACATDGNHGRAVARMARLLGFSARIFVPSDMAMARKTAIAGEGAEVIEIDGSYDDAIARSAEEASKDCLVISDTSWPGYEAVPGWVIEGYGSILWEIDDELTRLGEPGPDLVAVQIGVGAFARRSSAITGGRRLTRAHSCSGLNRPGPRARWPPLKPARSSNCRRRTIRSWPG